MDCLRGRVQAVTDLSAIRKWIAATAEASGLTGRASVWRLVGPEVQWVMRIDRPPYGQRLAIDVGLDLQTDTEPKEPQDCPIMIGLENLAVADEFWLNRALDLSSNLSDDERRRDIEGAVRALANYMSERTTLESVRAAYARGEFRAGFVHKDVRSILERDESP